MKTPTWAIVVGICMMVFGGCGAYRNLSSTKMIEAMEMQKDMIRMEVEKNIEENNRKESEEAIVADSLDMDEAETDVSADVESTEEDNNRVTIKYSTNSDSIDTSELSEEQLQEFEKMFNFSDELKTWIVRLGYLGLLVSLIYFLGGIFLVMPKPFSIQLAIAGLIVSCLFAITKIIVIKVTGDNMMLSIMSYVTGPIVVIINVILLIVISASDKSVFYPEEYFED